jgi:hypothetical protein
MSGLQEELELALELVDAADRISLSYFGPSA